MRFTVINQWLRHESSNQLKDICHGSSGWNTQMCLVKTTSCITHGRQSSCLDPFQSTSINCHSLDFMSVTKSIKHRNHLMFLSHVLSNKCRPWIFQANVCLSSSILCLAVPSSLSLHCHLAVPKRQRFVVSSQPMINHIIDVSLLDGPGLLLVPFHLSSWYCVSSYLNSSPSLDLWLNHLRIHVLFPKWATDLRLSVPFGSAMENRVPHSLPWSGVNSPLNS